MNRINIDLIIMAIRLFFELRAKYNLLKTFSQAGINLFHSISKRHWPLKGVPPFAACL